MNKFLSIAAAAMFSIGVMPNLDALNPNQNANVAAATTAAAELSPNASDEPMILALRAR